MDKHGVQRVGEMVDYAILLNGQLLYCVEKGIRYLSKEICRYILSAARKNCEDYIYIW